MAKKHASPSLAGPRSARYWAAAMGGYFIATLGVVSGIIRLLDWYAMPSTPEMLKPRLILSSIVIVLSLTAVAGLSHLAMHYRRRFHVHRDRGLIRDLYPNRDRLKGHYKNVLLDSTEYFRVVGISLHTLLSEPDLRTWVAQALSANEHLEIHLCFLKPYSVFVKQREREEHRAVGRISHDCLHNLHKALEIKEGLGREKTRFHIHVLESVPAAFLLQRDQEIYFEPYLAREVGRTFPTFVLSRNDANAEAFDKFSRHIDLLMAESTELEEPPAEPEPLITVQADTVSRQRLSRALFLDRDGVIVEDTGYISSPEGLRLRAGVIDALRELQHEFRIIIVSNQSGVARGYFTESDLFEINNRIVAMLDDHEVIIDAIYYCPHHPTVGVSPYRRDCECRKPKPGMILRAARLFHIDLKCSVVVGDAERDIASGRAAGTRSVIVRSQQQASGVSCADGEVTKMSDLPGVVRGLCGPPATEASASPFPA